MKKVFKTVSVSLLCIALSCVFALTSFADVIFEPIDDFYEAHSDECDIISANYIVMKETASYKSPSNHKIVKEYNVDEILYIDALYTDSSNVTWGYIEEYTEGGSWVPMGMLGRIVNSADFMAEYGDEIEKSDEEYDFTGMNVKMWNFPGEEGKGWEVYEMQGDQIGGSINEVFTDPNGEQWGHVPYYYANRGWVCISDPLKDEATWVIKSEPKIEYADSLIENSTAPTEQNILLIAGILVGALAAVCIVLLVVLSKKKKAN